MFSVDGTPDDWNFFSKDFKTHIPGTNSTELKLMFAKFATETDYIQESALSEMASYGQDGQVATDLTLPFELRFEPSAAVHTLFPSTLSGDPMMYVKQLVSVPENSILYNVHAMTGPKEL